MEIDPYAEKMRQASYVCTPEENLKLFELGQTLKHLSRWTMYPDYYYHDPNTQRVKLQTAVILKQIDNIRKGIK